MLSIALSAWGCATPPDFTTTDGRGWRVDTVCACPVGPHAGPCDSVRLDTTQVRTPDGPINY